MDNRDGFDIQKLDREVDELLSDVKDLLNENADSVNESGGEDTADADAAAPELPQEQAPETPAFPPEAMSDATVVYKPLTYYEQSKPAYQTARRAQYERERGGEPPKQKKKRHPVRTVLIVLLVLLLAGTAALWIAAKQPKAESALGARRKDCATILLAGTDKDGFRTDTMMLLSIDRANGTLSLVSIPRDTLVFCEYAIPKINSAYGWGGGGEDGMRELMLRVSEIIGFEPDGYVLIGLEGFEKLIDAMGGVEFNVPIDMRYSDPTQGLEIDLRAGEQRLSGSDAMQLVRFRSGYAMADLDRVTVQRAFVKAALSQWLSPEKLLRLPSALNTLKKYTQSDLTTENYLWLAESAMFCDLESVRMETLPGTAMYIGGGSYYVLDPSGVAETVNTCCNPYEQGVAVSDLSIRVG